MKYIATREENRTELFHPNIWLGHIVRFGYTKNGKSVSIIVIMKITIFSLVLVLLVSACSHKVESTAPSSLPQIAVDASKPHFEFTASDLAVPAEIGTNGVGSGHDTIIINLQLSTGKAAELAKFTQEHTNQQIQLIFDSKVVAEPFVYTPITGGAVQLAFSSLAQAQAVERLLSEK
ncbi:MAG TPA: hypothetical protein VMD27_06545 [Candidatus Aquilonibacter sp.]|nr:hypothetical protein [Candidatus Aquilonibacter sp.]